MQGFKSFKRNVSLPFNAGFTVITGPNGSGKSNIADAITFVLGTMSSRYLRAKKAGDLIFHGSKTKPPAEYAKVTLVFDNKDRSLPVDEDRVSISRRINKSGVSTYRINGKIVTRQNVMELLSQVNLYSDGHNIIHQGDVTKIIEMNPIERRRIIDEISGIMEYDEKKEKALKQLEKVGEKIREAEIILEQKEEIFQKIKEERDAALRYKMLADELEIIRAAILFKNYKKIEENASNIDKRIAEMEKSSVEIEREIKDLDKRIAEKEGKFEEFMKDVLNLSDQIEVSKTIAKLEADIERKKAGIESRMREIERINKMIESMRKVEMKPDLKPLMEFKGVHGMVRDLIIVPEEYRIAVDAAAGPRLNDIVVDTLDTAVKCIKYLKENKIGIARFLPLDRIVAREKKKLPEGAIAWLSEVIHHDIEYTPIVEYLFGGVACVKDIDMAKEIAKDKRVKIVTLDGDVIETSGAVTGGYYVKKFLGNEQKNLIKERGKLEEEIVVLNMELEELKKEYKEMKKKERRAESANLEKIRLQLKDEIERLKEKRRMLYEKRLNIQQELNTLRIEKAKLDASHENLQEQWKAFEEKWQACEFREELENKSISSLKAREKEILKMIMDIGPVNLKSIEEFETIKEEFEEFKERLDKIIEEKRSIESTIEKIEARKREVFIKTLTGVAKHFKDIFLELTGGEAELSLEEPGNIGSGLLISATPHGKKLLYIDAMSGGEKVLTALAFLFAIQRFKPSPFYILDEVDAALDKVNTQRVAKMIKKHSKDTQFIIISHNNELIKEADQIYGVSMDGGESKILAIKMPDEKIDEDKIKNINK